MEPAFITTVSVGRADELAREALIGGSITNSGKDKFFVLKNLKNNFFSKKRHQTLAKDMF